MEIGKDTEKARKVLEKGGLVIYPTETAYGIAADATSKDAVKKVYDIKERPESKGLTVIVDSLETAEKHAELSEKEKNIIRKLMPGPLTLVTERKNGLPEILNDDFVFRISSGKIASELASKGPITATSANISGEKTSYSLEEISGEILREVDYIIDAGSLEPSSTSTVAEVNNGEVLIHRRGPVRREEIQDVI